MHHCFSFLIQPKSSMGKTQTIQRAGSASRARASSDKFSHVKSSGYGVVHPSPTRTRSSSPGKAKGKTSAKKSPSKKSPSTSRHQSPEKGMMFCHWLSNITKCVCSRVCFLRCFFIIIFSLVCYHTSAWIEFVKKGGGIIIILELMNNFQYSDHVWSLIKNGDIMSG